MDFSLTTLFVVPVGNTIPSSGSTQDLTAGQVGFYRPDYSVATSGNIGAAKYFYVAQGRTNTFLQGSKRSDKIKSTFVTEWYKTTGNGTAVNEIQEVSGFNVKCGETVSLTIRAHSSYIDTLYFNGLTRSVTVVAPCCDCGGSPCDTVDDAALVDQIIAELHRVAPGRAADNISINTFFTFERQGTTGSAKLVISSKTLTKYGQPCDVAAFPWEYDRIWFRTFFYKGPETTADFLVADACDVAATTAVVQRSNYPSGTSAEVAQLEKDFYSYQAGYLKHLYRMNGYNGNFESWVTDGTVYDLYYIKFKEYDESYTWGDYVPLDSTVIIAAPAGTESTNVSTVLVAALGAATDASGAGDTTTTTTSTTTTSTSSTTTLIP